MDKNYDFESSCQQFCGQLHASGLEKVLIVVNKSSKNDN